jgi:lipopolysaccharide/colanic/teichoic acid biosynthesis glycosyltransferase
MKEFRLLLIDSATIILATVLGVLLRDNLEASSGRLISLIPYFAATAAASVLLIPLFGVNRLIWRFSALPDYLRLLSAMLAITIASVAITFAFNRLDGVPRSLPILQFNLATSLLIGLRVFYRLHHKARRFRRTTMTPLRVVEDPAVETVLLVGISGLTEAYLQSVSEIAPDRIKVVGVLGQQDRYIGRSVRAHRVLGTPENIHAVLSDLENSGVVVDKVVVTTGMASLSQEGCRAVAAVARSVPVIYLSESLGLESASARAKGQKAPHSRDREDDRLTFEIRTDELAAMRQRRYWNVKRLIDVIGAASLLILTSPLMIIVGLGVAFSLGRPLVFWQERPGLGGRPFRLYKFRTMGAAYAADGRKLSDAERSSGICSLLRRTRADEIPQLFNILRGDMSFIGPRPLLPRDQDPAYRARLLIRPGLTGWAQVVGGRAISAEDKAALDVWYVRNASLVLDLKVFLKTIPLVFFGETISRRSIELAWNDLRRAGVLRTKLSDPIARPRAAA